MNGPWKSDSPIVPGMRPNNAGQPAAEVVEERGLAKGNASQQTTSRTQSRTDVPPALERVRRAARRDRKARFTALFHRLTLDRLRAAFWALKRQAAAGVDGVTWQQYADDHEERLADLHARLHRGAYRAKPSRRVYIPKPDGRKRPLGIAALEDKIVQRAVVEVLNAIYEVDFLGFSYGFRPRRSQHDALGALAAGIHRRKVDWLLDADIRGFFDSIDHGWLMKFVEHRVADRRILRLIRKWLNAGVMEDGTRAVSAEGTPQGAVISPLLANIYLHYVLALWVQRWRSKAAKGDVIVVRYADDFVVGFQYRADAVQFQKELEARLGQFQLELHPEKTRLIAFGRYAIERQRKRGLGKPESYDFPGFTHTCVVNGSGRFFILRRTRRDRLRAKLRALKLELLRRRHLPIPALGRWLRRVLQGLYAYYAVPGNHRALRAFRAQVIWLWRRALQRRGQRCRVRWDRMATLAEHWLPMPSTQHPWPTTRFDATHPRQEPSALVALAGICAGGRG